MRDPISDYMQDTLICNIKIPYISQSQNLQKHNHVLHKLQASLCKEGKHVYQKPQINVRINPLITKAVLIGKHHRIKK